MPIPLKRYPKLTPAPIPSNLKETLVYPDESLKVFKNEYSADILNMEPPSSIDRLFLKKEKSETR